MCDAHFLFQNKSKYEQLVLLFENSKTNKYISALKRKQKNLLYIFNLRMNKILSNLLLKRTNLNISLKQSQQWVNRFLVKFF